MAVLIHRLIRKKIFLSHFVQSKITWFLCIVRLVIWQKLAIKSTVFDQSGGCNIMWQNVADVAT